MNQFETLRRANEQRQALWDKENKISLTYRGNEMGGEVAEAIEAVTNHTNALAQAMRVQNTLKKLEREQIGLVGSRSSIEKVSEELGDVIICIDLIAMDLGVDLWEAVRQKFNKTSEKHGFAVMISGEPAKNEFAGLFDHLQPARQEHDAVMSAIGHPNDGDGQEHSEIMREITGN